jgi:hypothetical protein
MPNPGGVYEVTNRARRLCLTFQRTASKNFPGLKIEKIPRGGILV